MNSFKQFSFPNFYLIYYSIYIFYYNHTCLAFLRATELTFHPGRLLLPVSVTRQKTSFFIFKSIYYYIVRHAFFITEHKFPLYSDISLLYCVFWYFFIVVGFVVLFLDDLLAAREDEFKRSALFSTKWRLTSFTPPPSLCVIPSSVLEVHVWLHFVHRLHCFEVQFLYTKGHFKQISDLLVNCMSWFVFDELWRPIIVAYKLLTCLRTGFESLTGFDPK